MYSILKKVRAVVRFYVRPLPPQKGGISAHLRYQRKLQKWLRRA
jgi:hypothetical protein